MVVHNKIVARCRDGRVLKGSTSDFLPNKDLLHLSLAEAPDAKPVEVRLFELKALFFVRDFAGNPQRRETQQVAPPLPAAGRRIRVVFEDGEVLVGTTHSYQPGRLGFFVVPVDPLSNNERCFIVASATREVSFP